MRRPRLYLNGKKLFCNALNSLGEFAAIDPQPFKVNMSRRQHSSKDYLHTCDMEPIYHKLQWNLNNSNVKGNANNFERVIDLPRTSRYI